MKRFLPAVIGLVLVLGLLFTRAAAEQIEKVSDERAQQRQISRQIDQLLEADRLKKQQRRHRHKKHRHRSADSQQKR